MLAALRAAAPGLKTLLIEKEELAHLFKSRLHSHQITILRASLYRKPKEASHHGFDISTGFDYAR